MIYLIINDGKDDAVMIPMSAVTNIGLAESEDGTQATLIITAEGQLPVLKTDTIDVITTDDSERYIAQKIHENFIKQDV